MNYMNLALLKINIIINCSMFLPVVGGGCVLGVEGGHTLVVVCGGVGVLGVTGTANSR